LEDSSTNGRFKTAARGNPRSEQFSRMMIEKNDFGGKFKIKIEDSTLARETEN